MRYIKKEISKELFDKANEIGYPGMKELFDIPIEWWCGYGYYGCAVQVKSFFVCKLPLGILCCYAANSFNCSSAIALSCGM